MFKEFISLAINRSSVRRKAADMKQRLFYSLACIFANYLGLLVRHTLGWANVIKRVGLMNLVSKDVKKLQFLADRRSFDQGLLDVI